MSKDKISVYISGAVGAFIACFSDLVRNGDLSTVAKIQGVLDKHYLPIATSGGIVATLLIVSLGVFICWVETPQSKSDALARGLSIFAIFTVVTPSSAKLYPSPQKMLQESSLWSRSAFAEERQNFNYADKDWEHGNATVISSKIVVSSCKPSYVGLFGLGSLFNNVLKSCPTEDYLKAQTRVRLLDSWDTGFRHHRYVKIQYLFKGNIKLGWIWSGQEPNYWFAVKPDNDKSSFLPQIK